ncbi:MAG: hypothetical protein EOO12_12820, partial [Chitinophagaceae bacterium]
MKQRLLFLFTLLALGAAAQPTDTATLVIYGFSNEPGTGLPEQIDSLYLDPTDGGSRILRTAIPRNGSDYRVPGLPANEYAVTAKVAGMRDAKNRSLLCPCCTNRSAAFFFSRDSKDELQTFMKVTIPAGYNGGDAQLVADFHAALSKRTRKALEKGGNVIVQLFVSGGGAVCTVSVLGGNLSEAVRHDIAGAVRKLGPWTAEVENGRPADSIVRLSKDFLLGRSYRRDGVATG